MSCPADVAAPRASDIDLAKLFPSSWVIGRSDGRFEPLSEFEPGAVKAKIMLVRDYDGEAVDAIAWASDRPTVWWTYRGTLDYIGEHELRRAWWDQSPARMVATPAGFVAAAGAAFCILRWDADIDEILGPVPGVDCDGAALAQKLRRTLIEQAAERRRILEAAIAKFPITVAARRFEGMAA